MPMSWTVCSFLPIIPPVRHTLNGVKIDVFDNTLKEVDYFMSLLTPERVKIIVQKTKTTFN